MVNQESLPQDRPPDETTIRSEIIISTNISSESQVEARFGEILEKIDACEAAFRRILERRGCQQEIIDNTALGLREALLNALLHGNFGDTALTPDKIESAKAKVINKLRLGESVDGEVRVVLEEGLSFLSVTIEDQGPGFDWQAAFEKADRMDEDRETLLRQQQRGLVLIRAFFGKENIKYNPAGNQLKLRVAFPNFYDQR